MANDTFKEALRSVVKELKNQQAANDLLKKLLLKFFPAELYIQLRPDVAEATNHDKHLILQHYIDYGHREINLEKELEKNKNVRNNINEGNFSIRKGSGDACSGDDNITSDLLVNKNNDYLHIKVDNNRLCEENLNLQSTISDNHLKQIRDLTARLLINTIANNYIANERQIHIPWVDENAIASYSQISISRFGPILHFGSNDLISKSLEIYGEWAQNEINFLKHFVENGYVVIDGGSYIGTHARSFSHFVGDSGKVYCFEPNNKSFEKLIINASISRFNNIHIHSKAIGNKSEIVSVVSNENSNYGDTVLENKTELASNSKTTRCIRLDDMIDQLKKVDFIKLDIEGMEIDAILGCNDLITKYHPTIYCEINSLTKAVEIYNWASLNKYKTWGCVHDAYNPVNFYDEKNDIFMGAKECGLLLLFEDGMYEKPPNMPGTNTRRVDSLDDLGLVLSRKPQYVEQAW